MAAETHQHDRRQEVAETAREILQTVEPYDRIRINQRSHPHTVEDVDRENGILSLVGIHDGEYELRPEWITDDGRCGLSNINANGAQVETIEIVDHHPVRRGCVYEVNDSHEGEPYIVVLEDDPVEAEWIDTVKVVCGQSEPRCYRRQRLLAGLKERVHDGDLSVAAHYSLGDSGESQQYRDTRTDTVVALTEPDEQGVDVREINGDVVGRLSWQDLLTTGRIEPRSSQ